MFLETGTASLTGGPGRLFAIHPPLPFEEWARGAAAVSIQSLVVS
jgi:hypothetical protein